MKVIIIFIAVTFLIIGLPLYFARLILDYFAKKYAGKIAEEIIKEFEAKGMLVNEDLQKMTEQDVADFLNTEKRDKEIEKYINND